MIKLRCSVQLWTAWQHNQYQLNTEGGPQLLLGGHPCGPRHLTYPWLNNPVALQHWPFHEHLSEYMNTQFNTSDPWTTQHRPINLLMFFNWYKLMGSTNLALWRWWSWSGWPWWLSPPIKGAVVTSSSGSPTLNSGPGLQQWHRNQEKEIAPSPRSRVRGWRGRSARPPASGGGCAKALPPNSAAQLP